MSDHTSTPSRPGSPLADLPDIQTPRPFRFTWDPSSSRRRGPGSLAETTEAGKGDYLTPTPRTDLFSTPPSTLALGILPTDWSSSKHGFHAISTVLNNPHKRQAPPKAHSSLPAVPPAELPRVKRKDFDGYLRAVAPEWERFEKNTQLGRDGAAQLDTTGSPTTPRTAVPAHGRPLPPLDSVPSVFFTPNFNLGDPHTFDTVTEQDPTDPSSDPTSISYSLPLLEKFSHYADTVEQHLVQEISLRSTSFFAALTNLNDLQTSSKDCLSRISNLRAQLKDKDIDAKKGLQVVTKEQKVRNIGKVKEGVKVVGGVVEMTGVAKGLVNAGQWGEALGVIEEMENMWDPISTKTSSLNSAPTVGNGLSPTLEDAGAPPTPSARTKSPSLPLSSLKAFAALPTHLRTLTLEITASLTSELVNVLRHDLVERINGSASEAGFKDRLRPLLHGLMRTKGVRTGLGEWREIVMDEVRSTIRQRLPPGIDTGPSNSKSLDLGSGQGNHLRKMNQSTFLTLIQSVYKSLLNCVEGLQCQGIVIVDVLSGIQFPNIPALQEELSDILSSATELCNTRAASIISVRSEEHAALELPEFLEFFNESWTFVVKCEVLCRRMIVGLRGVVVGQAKIFLQAFHQTRISHSAKLVEDEQWNPAEVTSDLQRVVDVLVDSAVRDSPELVITSATSSDFSPSSPTVNGHTSPPGSPSAPAPKSSSKQLRIESVTYYTVSCTCTTLVLLSDYLKIIVNLSMLTTDTMSRVIEFLKAFNSRTCQVVLGAGAMRSAGLKNITAKHLALASQSLSVMIALIPYVREMFRRHLNSKQAVMLVEFDKLKRDFQEHQNEIHAKLIAIMGDRLTAHIKTLQSINWDVPRAGGGANDYMELLVKETVTLHKVLSRYLAPPIVEYVMTQVYAAINHRLSEEYAKIELPSQEAKDRLLADAKFLYQKLSSLKNVGTPSSMLETVISEKSTTNRHQPPASSFRNNATASPLKAPVLTPNQRIQGMFKVRTSSPAVVPVEKILPSPVKRESGQAPPELDTAPGQVTNGPQPTHLNGKVDVSRVPLPRPPPDEMGEMNHEEVESRSGMEVQDREATLSTGTLEQEKS